MQPGPASHVMKWVQRQRLPHSRTTGTTMEMTASGISAHRLAPQTLPPALPPAPRSLPTVPRPCVRVEAEQREPEVGDEGGRRQRWWREDVATARWSSAYRHRVKGLLWAGVEEDGVGEPECWEDRTGRL